MVLDNYVKENLGRDSPAFWWYKGTKFPRIMQIFQWIFLQIIVNIFDCFQVSSRHEVLSRKRAIRKAPMLTHQGFKAFIIYIYYWRQSMLKARLSDNNVWIMFRTASFSCCFFCSVGCLTPLAYCLTCAGFRPANFENCVTLKKG